MIITIDGLGGTGKSSQSKLLAKELGFTYFNTGSLYRYLTLKLILDNVQFEDPAVLKAYLDQFEFKFDDSGKLVLDAGLTEKDLGTMEVSVYSATVAAVPDVKARVVAEQRKFGNSHNTIMEGRDIGSVIFPNADLKFFLDATPETRARRVFLQGRDNLPYEEILAGILERDQVEKEKKTFVPPQNAIKINTDNLSFEEVAKILLEKSLQKMQELGISKI